MKPVVVVVAAVRKKSPAPRGCGLKPIVVVVAAVRKNVTRPARVWIET